MKVDTGRYLPTLYNNWICRYPGSGTNDVGSVPVPTVFSCQEPFSPYGLADAGVNGSGQSTIAGHSDVQLLRGLLLSHLKFYFNINSQAS